jgi:S1-C subfamily serine protease
MSLSYFLLFNMVRNSRDSSTGVGVFLLLRRFLCMKQLPSKKVFLSTLLQKLSPSVVSIQDVKLAPSNRNNRGKVPDPIIEGQGSGFVWDTYGHIVSSAPTSVTGLQ